MPGWLRGLLQAGGGITGIFLGMKLQRKDDALTAAGAAQAAQRHLLALAAGVQTLIENIDQFRRRSMNSPPASIAASGQNNEIFLAGADSQVRAMLAHIKAAEEAWEPFRQRDDGPDLGGQR